MHLVNWLMTRWWKDADPRAETLAPANALPAAPAPVEAELVPAEREPVACMPVAAPEAAVVALTPAQPAAGLVTSSREEESRERALYFTPGAYARIDQPPRRELQGSSVSPRNRPMIGEQSWEKCPD